MSADWIVLSGVWLVTAIALFAIIALAYSAGHRAGWLEGFWVGLDDAIRTDELADSE